MNLTRLVARRQKRRRSLGRHRIEWTRRKAAGHKIRAAWHLRLLRSDRKAIEKLDLLIAEERARRIALRIDWNGKEPLTYKPLLKAVRAALTVSGLFVSSTTGGVHSPTSWHYKRRAVDFGSNGPGEAPEIEAQNLLLAKFGAAYFAELFGPDNWYVKNGVKYDGVFPNHGDHLHVAVA